MREGGEICTGFEIMNAPACTPRTNQDSAPPLRIHKQIGERWYAVRSKKPAPGVANRKVAVVGDGGKVQGELVGRLVVVGVGVPKGAWKITREGHTRKAEAVVIASGRGGPIIEGSISSAALGGLLGRPYTS